LQNEPVIELTNWSQQQFDCIVSFLHTLKYLKKHASLFMEA